MSFWDKYYDKDIDGDNVMTTDASSWAIFVSRLVEEGQTMIDLGAGNGRDSLFFHRGGLVVTACDMANSLKDKSVPFICGSMDGLEEISFDCAYSCCICLAGSFETS
jgi:hypothetical protein